MQIKSLNIVGDGVRHSFATAFAAQTIQCKWMQVAAPAANAAAIMIGGNDVSALIGFPLPAPYAGMMLPPIAEISNFYHLDRCFYFAAAGDTFNVLIGID